MPTLVFYISSHGFGHATRQIEVINTLLETRPDLRVIVRTAAPTWLFERSVRHPVLVQPVETDTGVVQLDALTVDVAASFERAWEFHRELPRRADEEAAFLRALKPALVVSDIPPLAFAAADRAEVPAAALANFTWDWIYKEYEEYLDGRPELVPLLGKAYSTAKVAWRLPLAGGFETFKHVVDLPLIARCSTRDPRQTRRTLRLPEAGPLVLVAFGRYGLGAVQWTKLSCPSDCVIVHTAASGIDARAAQPSVAFIAEENMSAKGIRYEDLIAAVDVVVTKPGYGMIAECAANGTAILYTARGRFAEYDVLVAEMPRLVRCAFIEQTDLLGGRWNRPLEQLLAAPKPPRPDISGAEVVAGQILALIEGRK